MNYPFENDTERIEKRIAEKSVFSEKNRTFLIRVIILIAAFLLSFSGILLCNATLSTQQIAHVIIQLKQQELFQELLLYFFVRQGWLSKIFFMYLYCNEYMNLHNYGQSAQHTSKLNQWSRKNVTKQQNLALCWEQSSVFW